MRFRNEMGGRPMVEALGKLVGMLGESLFKMGAALFGLRTAGAGAALAPALAYLGFGLAALVVSGVTWRQAARDDAGAPTARRVGGSIGAAVCAALGLGLVAVGMATLARGEP